MLRLRRRRPEHSSPPIEKQPLPRSVWVLNGARTIASLGTGLTMLLILVYLHQVRGIPLAVTGELFALAAVAGLAAVPLAGVAVDRLGARQVLVAACAAQALSAAGLAWAHESAMAAPVMVVQGLSVSPLFPAFTTMIGGLCPDTGQQQRAFGWCTVATNAAIGIGGAIGGLVVDVRHVVTFQALFLANAAAAAVCAVLVARLPDTRAERGEELGGGTGGKTGSSDGFRQVLGIPALRTVMFTAVFLAFTSYAVIDAGLPAYGT